MSVIINKWNRKSENDRFIRELENGAHQYFQLTLYGDAGRYWVAWHRENRSIERGYISNQWMPLDDENGSGTIKYARFSKAFLEKCDKVIQSNMEKYYNLWTTATKKDLFDALYDDINAIK